MSRRSTKRQWAPIACVCRKRVALRSIADGSIRIADGTVDHDLPWVTCPRCGKSSRIEDLEAANDERRSNGWAS